MEWGEGWGDAEEPPVAESGNKSMDKSVDVIVSEVPTFFIARYAEVSGRNIVICTVTPTGQTRHYGEMMTSLPCGCDSADSSLW